MKIVTLFCLLLISTFVIGQSDSPDYKSMMYDNSINFYDVIASAEAYFSTIDRDAKGSGYKPFQRWKYANEYKYYPSGDRSKINHSLPTDEYQAFLRKNKISQRNLYPEGWKELGPTTVDSITGHYAAGLGRVEDMYIDPNNSNLLYLGSRSGGFWKSTNGGQTWNGGSTDFLVASGVNTIGVSPSNPDSILINVRNASNGHSHGIYRSINGGVTWLQTNFNPTNIGFGGLGSSFQIYEIKYHPTVPNLIYIGTSEGIYRSSDNLNTWTRLLNSADIVEIAFHPTNSDIVYLYDSYYWASTHNQIHRSVDGGLSYSLSNEMPNNNDNRSVRLSTSPVCPDCLYVGSSTGVWKSTDNGMNFTFLNNPSQGCGGFAVSDIDTTKLVYGYVDIMGSTDGGANWSQLTYWSLGNTNGSGSGHQNSYNTSTNYIHADQNNLKCVNGVFYTATDGFLSKSTDNGLSWTKLDDGLGIRENYCLGVSQSNTFRSISGSQDNGTSIKHKDTWIEFYGADGMEGIIHPLNDDYMLGSFQNGGRRKTTDGGQNNFGATPAGSSSASWVAPLTYDPNDHFTVYDFRDVIYKSTDFAETYSIVGSPSSFTGNINQSAIAENNSDIIIISKGSAIDKSVDGGATFSNIRNNLPNHSIQDIAFDPNDDNTIIVVYANYDNNGQKIYVTHDGGLVWNNITHNLGNMPIRSVVIDHTPQKNIYVGAEIGVYTMPMNNNNWVLYSDNLPNTTAAELEIVYGSNTLKVATWGRGMWEYTLVGRQDYPAITYTTITNNPTLDHPKATVDQYVTSKIHYAGILSDVSVKWSVDQPIFDQTINMSLLSDTTWQSDTPLPDFPAGTKMYFKVQSVGSNLDTTVTYKFMYTIRPFEYCDANGSNDNGNLYMSNVSINSGAILDNFSGQSLYEEYTNPVYLNANTTYDISISNNTGWGDNDNGAWIDYDNDSDFKLDEQILFDPNTGSSSASQFTVPMDVKVNQLLKMRTRVSYWGSNPSPCGTTLGEVEDYIVIIKDCNLVTNTNDSGLGSLREAIACAMNGDTIRFSENIHNSTIIINSSPLTILKDLVILSAPNENIVVSSTIPQRPNISSVFDIPNSNSVEMHDFHIIGGYGLEGSGILNNGLLELHSMIISNGDKTDILSTVKNLDGGQLKVFGISQID